MPRKARVEFHGAVYYLLDRGDRREEGGNKGERFWFNTASHITRALYKADNVSTNSPSNGVLDQQYAYTPDMLNRTSVTENGAVTNYAAPTALNQYTSVGGVEVRYDGNFNLTYYGGATATYDAQNRLTSVNAGGTGGFVYDGLGRCVKRTINGVATQFGYDGWKPVTEYDGAGNLAARNIYGPGPDEILMRGSGFGWFFYHADKQGSVQALVDLSGNVVEKYSYDAFGRPTILSANNTQLLTSAVGNRFMFTGREWIAELNIYDYRNRFYFPAIGRFLQTDPTGLDGGDMNLFRYCMDDPINLTDPTGLRYERPVQSYSGMVDVSFDSGLASMSREQKLDSGNYSMGAGGVISASSRGQGGTIAQVAKSAVTRVVGGTPQERKEMRRAVSRVLNYSRRGREAVKLIKQSGGPLIVNINPPEENYTWTPKRGGREINISPVLSGPGSLVETTAGTIPYTLTRQVAHEIGHAVFGLEDAGPDQMENVNKTENPIMRDLGEPERTRY